MIAAAQLGRVTPDDADSSADSVSVRSPHMSTRAHTVPQCYLGGFVAPASETRREPGNAAHPEVVLPCSASPVLLELEVHR